MDEKTIVEDVLQNIKNEISEYQNAIFETKNLTIRQELQQIRDNNESFQYEVSKIAEAKGYKKQDTIAQVQEINAVKKEVGV